MGNAAVQLMALGAIKNLKEARKVIKNSVQLIEYLPQ
jgi:hypothetical protein